MNHGLHNIEVYVWFGSSFFLENKRFSEQHPGNTDESEQDEKPLNTVLTGVHVCFTLRAVRFVILKFNYYYKYIYGFFTKMLSKCPALAFFMTVIAFVVT